MFAATLARASGSAGAGPVPFVVAGGLAAAGQVSWVAMLVGAIVGNLIGDGLWFWAGRR